MLVFWRLSRHKANAGSSVCWLECGCTKPVIFFFVFLFFVILPPSILETGWPKGGKPYRKWSASIIFITKEMPWAPRRTFMIRRDSYLEGGWQTVWCTRRIKIVQQCCLVHACVSDDETVGKFSATSVILMSHYSPSYVFGVLAVAANGLTGTTAFYKTINPANGCSLQFSAHWDSRRRKNNRLYLTLSSIFVYQLLTSGFEP